MHSQYLVSQHYPDGTQVTVGAATTPDKAVALVRQAAATTPATAALRVHFARSSGVSLHTGYLAPERRDGETGAWCETDIPVDWPIGDTSPPAVQPHELGATARIVYDALMGRCGETVTHDLATDCAAVIVAMLHGAP